MKHGIPNHFCFGICKQKRITAFYGEIFTDFYIIGCTHFLLIFPILLLQRKVELALSVESYCPAPARRLGAINLCDLNLPGL